MDAGTIKAIWADGMKALEAGNELKAESLLSRAMILIEELEDPELRQQMYRTAVFALNRSPFSALALKAAQEALAFDRSSKHPGRLAADLLAYGTVLANHDQLHQAARVFQDVLDLSLGSNRLADAASASTNLGAMLARQGDTAGALTLWRRSLEYLKSEKFPETEIFTRLNILAVYEETETDPRTCLEFARETIDSLVKHMDAGTHERVMTHVRHSADRLLRSRPRANERKWLTDTFPELAATASSSAGRHHEP
jgi:tetratricopeptide (TPR) repeat protein